MKTITNFENLPKWFSLDKYSATVEFNLNDWLNAFKLRYWLFFLKDAHNESDADFGGLEPRSHAQYELIMAHGASAHKICANIDYEKRPEPAIESLEVYDLILLHESVVANQKSNRHKKAYDLVHNDDDGDFDGAELSTLLRIAVHDVLDPNYYPIHQVAFAQVNLNAPNSIILDHFEKWLKEVKKNHQQLDRTLREKRYSEKDSFKWAQSGVLPYLDLTLWAKLEGNAISNRIMENAIFSIEREINVSEALKVTTIPLAERVLSGEIVDGLEADLTGRASVPALKSSKKL